MNCLGSRRKGRLVHIKFLDHVIFKDSNPIKVKPVLRETLGWIYDEDERAVWILWVRDLNSPQERIQRSTGICILKSDILEVREVEMDGEA